MPNQSVHIGFSSFAFHFMSETPKRNNEIVEIIYPEAASQMINDLKVLFTHRINELVIGGFLIIIIAGRIGEENGLIYNLGILLILKLFETGRISKQEHLDFY